MTQVPTPAPMPAPTPAPATASIDELIAQAADQYARDLAATVAAIRAGSAPPPASVPSSNLPVAEAGTSTSEWRLVLGTIVADAIALATSFGAPIDARQQAAILSFVGAISGLTGLYALARNIRKTGTTA